MNVSMVSMFLFLVKMMGSSIINIRPSIRLFVHAEQKARFIKLLELFFRVLAWYNDS